MHDAGVVAEPGGHDVHGAVPGERELRQPALLDVGQRPVVLAGRADVVVHHDGADAAHLPVPAGAPAAPLHYPQAGGAAGVGQVGEHHQRSVSSRVSRAGEQTAQGGHVMTTVPTSSITGVSGVALYRTHSR